MHRASNRRQFLSRCASLSVGALGAASYATRSVSAIEPIQRTGQPKFKFSVAAYSYRRLLTGENPKLTLADFVDDCAAMGLEGTELTSYYFPNPTTPDYIRSLKQHCFRLGLDVSGTAVGNDFAHPSGEQRQQQIAAMKQWIENAEMLGAPVIRIFAGKQKPGISEAESHALMVSAIEECCAYAGDHGVFLALENHGGPTSTADGMLSLVHDVQSPWFGVNLDTGNFRTDDPYHDLQRLAPYAINVQVKVTISTPDRKEERPTDFKRLARMLRETGYRGYVVLEYEEDGDPRTECPRYVDLLREVFV